MHAAARRAPDVDVKPGEYVDLVTDTVGMDEATRTHVRAFTRRRRAGHARLSTVYGFVRQCGGLSVMSTPGGHVDRTAAAACQRARADPSRNPNGQARHVRCGPEDEDGVRELAVETLERRGYRVLAATSGEEALKTANAYDGTIHLLISDVVMPGMKGPVLADRLRVLRPGVRVLLMSGYATDVVTPTDLNEAMFLTKPFAPETLVKIVRQILDVPLSTIPDPRR
jgi:CheY-like chemotaxis protein